MKLMNTVKPAVGTHCFRWRVRLFEKKNSNDFTSLLTIIETLIISVYLLISIVFVCMYCVVCYDNIWFVMLPLKAKRTKKHLGVVKMWPTVVICHFEPINKYTQWKMNIVLQSITFFLSSWIHPCNSAAYINI